MATPSAPSPEACQKIINELIKKTASKGGSLNVTVTVKDDAGTSKGICLVCVSTPLGNVCVVPPDGSC